MATKNETLLLDVLLALQERGIEPVRVGNRLFYFHVARFDAELWSKTRQIEPQLKRHLLNQKQPATRRHGQ